MICAATVIIVMHMPPAQRAMSEHRQESIACVIDALGVPCAWGLSSALHNPLRPLGAMHWLVRVTADALFLPYDDCAAFAQSASARSAIDCLRGGWYFAALQILGWDRGAPASSEALHAFSALALTSDDASADEQAAKSGAHLADALLHAAKALVFIGAPAAGDTRAYFLAAQIELAWAAWGGEGVESHLSNHARAAGGAGARAPAAPTSKAQADGQAGGAGARLRRWARRRIVRPIARALGALGRRVGFRRAPHQSDH